MSPGSLRCQRPVINTIWNGFFKGRDPTIEPRQIHHCAGMAGTYVFFRTDAWWKWNIRCRKIPTVRAPCAFGNQETTRAEITALTSPCPDGNGDFRAAI